MTAPSFSRFRSGTPAKFASGEQISYSELHKSGLQEHYLRIIYKLVTEDKVSKAQVQRWLERAASKDRTDSRKVRTELEATQPASVAAPTSTPSKATATGSSRSGSSRSAPATKKRGRSEKLLTLVSKGNHKEALKAAKNYDLSPTQVAQAALRPGQSAEAHTVQAPTSVASKLITTGYWATR